MINATPIVYGARYSVYVQALQLCLEEKSVAYRLEDVDVFAPGGPPPEHRRRHPFGRIPAFAHGSLMLYETAPICRYVDEAFDGPPLQPVTATGRARMGQAIAIGDQYAYAAMVWGLFVETVERPARGEAPDPARVAAAVRTASTCLQALEALAPGEPWIAGSTLSLADFHLAPMFALFLKTPAARVLAAEAPRLGAWFERFCARPSAQAILAPPAS